MPPDRWGKGRENSRFVLLVARTAEANMYKKVCTSGESLLLRDMNAVVREYLIQERGFHCFPPCFSLTSPSCVISTPRARLSPKVCHRDHGRTWPRTHLPLNVMSAILLMQARERAINALSILLESTSTIVQRTECMQVIPIAIKSRMNCWDTHIILPTHHIVHAV